MFKKKKLIVLIAFVLFFSGHAFGLAFQKSYDINISAPATLDLNNQFTIVIDLNSQITSQVTDNVDLNDLTIFYNDTNLARRVEKYGANARLYFRIPAGLTILKGTSDRAFSLKFKSDTNVSRPFINDVNVFLRWFDFNGASIPPNLDTNNAAIANGTIRLVNSLETDDAYILVNDLNFNRDWGSTIESDINVGTLPGLSFGFNDTVGTNYSTDMNISYYLDTLNSVEILGDNAEPTFGVNFSANQIIKVKISGKLGTGARAYHTFNTTTFDWNQVYNGNNPSSNVVRLGVGVKHSPAGSNPTFDNWKLYYDANIVGAIILLQDTNFLSADINSNPASPLALDPENGINSRNTDFNSIINKSSNVMIASYNWKVNGTIESTAISFVRAFTATGDYNVSLIVTATNGLISQKDLNYLVRNNAQGLDINFSLNIFTNNASINYGLTATGTYNYVVWGGTNFDVNLVGTNISKTYTSEGVKQVCAIVNTTGDLNKLKCENFTATRFLTKRPIQEGTSTILTPFSITTSSPNQTYNGQTLDLNVYTFFQTSTTFNLTADFNTDYYPRTYSFSLTDSNILITIQPYLASTSQAVLVTITVIDGFIESPLPNYKIDLFKDVNSTQTLVESETTDGAGVTIFSMIASALYTAKIYNTSGNFVDQENISTSSTTYYWRINPITIPDYNTSTLPMSVTFYPSQVLIRLTDANVFRVAEDINTLGSLITANIKIVVNDANTLYDQNVSIDANHFQDLNFNGFANNSRVKITVTVRNSRHIQVFEKLYVLKFANYIDIMTLFRDIKEEDLSPFGALLVSIFVSVLVTGWFGLRIGFDTSAMALVLITILGIFAFISWVPLIPYALLSLGTLAALVSGRRI